MPEPPACLDDRLQSGNLKESYMKSKKRLLALAVLVATLGLTAAARVDLGVAVGTPPPPPPPGVIVGPVGVAPAPGYVWVPGYWNWDAEAKDYDQAYTAAQVLA